MTRPGSPQAWRSTAEIIEDRRMNVWAVREYVGVSYLMYDDILRVMNEAK